MGKYQTDVDVSKLLTKLRSLPGSFQSIVKPEVESQAGLLAVRIVKFYTPPASEKSTGNNAKKKGEMSITADLLGLGISAGRDKSTRTAGVFMVLNDDMLAATAKQRPNGTVQLFVTKDGTVFGTEKKFYRPNASMSEMKSHHESLRGKGGKVTKAGGGTRDIGRWRFVDQMVVGVKTFRKYEKLCHKKVGLLASGWLAAARKYKRKLPVWVERHGESRGSSSELNADGKIIVTMTNRVKFAGAQGMQAKANEAAKVQHQLMLKRIRYVINAILKKSRLG